MIVSGLERIAQTRAAENPEFQDCQVKLRVKGFEHDLAPILWGYVVR